MTNQKDAKSIQQNDILIGKQIAHQRMLAGMSRKQLADDLGITHQQVQKYENGKNRIAASRLMEIADIFNISVVEFYVPTERTLHHGAEENSLLNTRLLKYYGLLNEHQQDAIRNLLKSLAEAKTLARAG